MTKHKMLSVKILDNFEDLCDANSFFNTVLSNKFTSTQQEKCPLIDCFVYTAK